MKDYRGYFLRYLATLIDAVGWLVFFWLPRPNVQPGQAKSLLILKFDRIGDTFLAEPTIEALRQTFPKTELTVACSPWNQAVLANNPAIDRLLPIQSLPDVHHSRLTDFLRLTKIKQLAYFIKAQEPEVVIDLQGSPMNVLAMLWSGARYRLGYQGKVLSFLLTQAARYRRNQPQVEIYFSMAKMLGYLGQPSTSRLFPSSGDIAAANRLVTQEAPTGFIVFHLGAGRSYRQWPVNNFSTLAQQIIDNYSNYRLIVIGGKEDQVFFEKFISLIKQPQRVVNAIGQLNIPASYELIRQAQLFIGNESGPGHLAAASGVPVISFMSPWSGIDRWQARGSQVSLFYHRAHHCQGIRCHLDPCPNMTAITVDEVWAKVQTALG